MPAQPLREPQAPTAPYIHLPDATGSERMFRITASTLGRLMFDQDAPVDLFCVLADGYERMIGMPRPDLDADAAADLAAAKPAERLRENLAHALQVGAGRRGLTRAQYRASRALALALLSLLDEEGLDKGHLTDPDRRQPDSYREGRLRRSAAHHKARAEVYAKRLTDLGEPLPRVRRAEAEA